MCNNLFLSQFLSLRLCVNFVFMTQSGLNFSWILVVHLKVPQFQLCITFQTNKVVLLEELACQFGLRTQDAIDRLQALQEMERITGIKQLLYSCSVIHNSFVTLNSGQEYFSTFYKASFVAWLLFMWQHCGFCSGLWIWKGVGCSYGYTTVIYSWER